MRRSARIGRQALAALLGAAALAWSTGASFAQEVAMREQAGIRYACSGVGDEERGGYLAGVPLSISRAGGAPGRTKPAVLAFPDDSFDGIRATEEEKRGRAAQGR